MYKAYSAYGVWAECTACPRGRAGSALTVPVKQQYCWLVQDMAFIRYPSRARTLSTGGVGGGVVSALNNHPPTLWYVQNQTLCSGCDCILDSSCVFPASTQLWETEDHGASADRTRTTGKTQIHQIEPSISLAGFFFPATTTQTTGWES